MQKLHVPKLRFPEFEGEWVEYKMGEIAPVVDCKHRTPEYIESGYPVVSPGTITWGRLDLESPVKRVSKYEYKSLMDHCAPKLGDLVFSRNQSLGVAAIVTSDRGFVLGQDTVLIQINSEKAASLYYFLQTTSTQQQIARLSGGSTFSRINLKDIRLLKCTLSSYNEEQQKIASFLTAVDEKIGQLERKKALLTDYKKGCMQQIFSQQLRFKDDQGNNFPDWEEKKLGDYCEIISGNPVIGDEIVEYKTNTSLLRGINVTEGRIRHSDDIDRYHAGEVIGLERFIVQEGDIVIAMDGSKVGKNVSVITRHDCGAFLIQRVARLRATGKNYLQYAYHHIFSIFFRGYVDRINTSSGIPHISLKQIKDFKIATPHPAEQKKIADFLTAQDKKIELTNQKITQAQAFKKGLLQQMFI
ncbi:restriction endonuclease subunit S [Akkermansiaceae bacterium]|nr:restriction endonuclease subunit S [Akkermansiaceae bacterium]